MAGIRPPTAQQDRQITGVHVAVAVQIGHAPTEADARWWIADLTVRTFYRLVRTTARRIAVVRRAEVFVTAINSVMGAAIREITAICRTRIVIIAIDFRSTADPLHTDIGLGAGIFVVASITRVRLGLAFARFWIARAGIALIV